MRQVPGRNFAATKGAQRRKIGPLQKGAFFKVVQVRSGTSGRTALRGDCPVGNSEVEPPLGGIN